MSSIKVYEPEVRATIMAAQLSAENLDEIVSWTGGRHNQFAGAQKEGSAKGCILIPASNSYGRAWFDATIGDWIILDRGSFYVAKNIDGYKEKK